MLFVLAVVVSTAALITWLSTARVVRVQDSWDNVGRLPGTVCDTSPVINDLLSIETQEEVIVYDGPTGLLYTLKDDDGHAVVSCASQARLRLDHPDLYDRLTGLGQMMLRERERKSKAAPK